MKTRVLIFCLALIFSGGQVFAQLSKKEKKEWKKKAKEYAKNPANLKMLTEEKQTADNTVTSLKGDVSRLQSSNSDKDSKIADLEDQLSKARRDLTSTIGLQLLMAAANTSSGSLPDLVWICSKAP